ncbi:MAG: hypothetical protein JWN17_1031 [Frankiales bacterium]|nr:hypothetical protein [Frankiales bacterium]
MRAAGVFDRADPDGAAAEVTRVLRGWQVRGGAARLWTASAAAHVRSSPAEWVVEYDEAVQLVSFEVFEQERRVFGIDDWLG